jgi:peptidoglycan hydrolase-like protein with peptidoglycan-binding domain
MIWICMPRNGPCVKLVSLEGPSVGASSSDSAGSGAGQVVIGGPVGTRGNRKEDVITIQDALNRVPLRQGGASPPLAVDGISGPKTQKAIQTFQLQHFGWKGADSLIEPGKQTLAKLNEVLGSTGLLPAVPDLSICIQIALSWILRAQTNLLMADPVVDSRDTSAGPISVFNREARMRLLNTHFALDSQNFKRDVFNRILNVYNRMLQVFRRPGGLWGPAVFDFDPLDKKLIAYTPWGGYFKPGRVGNRDGRTGYWDTIYLCPGFNGLVSEDMRAFVIVHELAHFVGYPQMIDDLAYNWQGNGSRIRNLQPASKILNAESYANFAHEAGTGSDLLLSR